MNDLSFPSRNTSLPQVIEVDPKFKELMKEYISLSNKTTTLFISLPKIKNPQKNKIKIKQLISVSDGFEA